MTMTKNKRTLNSHNWFGRRTAHNMWAGCPDWDDFELDCYDIKPAESYEVTDGESGGNLLMFDPNE